MQDILKQLKQNYLEQLKTKKTEVENQKAELAAQRYAEKKQNLDAEAQALDDALALFIQQKQQRLNEEIAQKRQEVADKKANIETTARSTAEAEIEAEVSHAIQAFEKEIALIEKELL
nr:MAG TPA: hypothetical protein [Caudoviricetes sp.]